jgi:hypothetical protein
VQTFEFEGKRGVRDSGDRLDELLAKLLAATGGQ